MKEVGGDDGVKKQALRFSTVSKNIDLSSKKQLKKSSSKDVITENNIEKVRSDSVDDSIPQTT